MINSDKTYQDMHVAANKAEQASKDYERREQFIELREKTNFNRERPGADEFNLQQVIDDSKEADRKLASAFNRYKFWRGEQIRLGELLTAEWIYRGLKADNETAI